MAVYKEEKTGTWRVIYRYTDWTGERKQTQKRGFKTKRDAQAWEREQQNKATSNLDMTFASFVEQYTADMKTRLKENTWATKEHIIRSKLLPYFGKLKMCNITAQQIITWQNEMLNYKDDKGKPYSLVYLKTVHNQLSAIFNHTVRYQLDDLAIGRASHITANIAEFSQNITIHPESEMLFVVFIHGRPPIKLLWIYFRPIMWYNPKTELI